MLTVVCGPPCSGKTTYVREHARAGDIVIDYDALARALGSPVPHDHASPVRRVTGVVRRAAIEAAVKEHCNGATVWIVDGKPTDHRSRMYRNVGARVVVLDVDKAELHRRAARERPALWHGLIDAWHDSGVAVSSVDIASREW